MLKKNKLLFISFLILVNLLFVSLTTAFAAMIEVGASAESAYQTQGNCAHGDRVAGIYVTKFLDAITYDPWFGDPVATTSFNWHNEWAWESDLLPGGPVDTVDFMVFSGHGFGQGLHNVPYNSLHYYTLNSSTDFHSYGESYESLDAANVDSFEVWWGSGTNAKTKWVTTYSCNFLNTAGSYWVSIMQGVHLVMGFGSVMWVNSDEGDYYGDRLREGAKVKDAFFEGNREYQPHTGQSNPIICRVLGADISKDDTILSYSGKPAPIGGSDEYYYWTLTVQPPN